MANEYAVDTKDRMLDLSDARMANIVGITLIAITSDGYVLFVRQTARNSVLPKGIAASSSGSLDWADATRVNKQVQSDKRVTLQDVVFEGMLRELLEESQVRPEEVVSTSRHIIGYFRWLSRGAKPEFTGIARLCVDLAALEQRNVHGVEKNYTDARLAVPVGLLLSSANSWHDAQATLYDALYQQLSQPGFYLSGERKVPIGVSSIAAWCAAADFVAAHPEYVQNSWRNDEV